MVIDWRLRIASSIFCRPYPCLSLRAMAIAFAILACLVDVTFSLCTFQDKPDPELVATATALMTKHPQAFYHVAQFDLGVLPVGKQVSVQLTLENPYDATFKFDQLQKTCNCLNLKAEHTEIPPMSSVKFSMTLHTPKSGTNGIAASTISLVDSSESDPAKRVVVNLRFDYRLAGVLMVDRELVLVEIAEDAEFADIQVPVLVTDPIRTEQLKVEASGSLRDVVFSIDATDGKPRIVGTVPGISLDAGSIGGEVRIIHEESGRNSSFFLTVRRKAPCQLSPLRLQFRPDSDGKSKATAILRFMPPLEKTEAETGSGQPVASEPVISVSANGWNISTNSHRMARGIFRIYVFLEQDQAEEENEGVAKWTVNYLGKEFELETGFDVFRF